MIGDGSQTNGEEHKENQHRPPETNCLEESKESINCNVSNEGKKQSADNNSNEVHFFFLVQNF